VVRGGGVAHMFGVAVATLLLPGELRGDALQVLALALLLGAIGLADDVKEIGHGPKFIYQVVTLALASYVLSGLMPDGSFWLGMMTFFVMLCVTNSFNFMDGINGVSCVCAALTFAGYAIVAAAADEELIVALSIIGMLAALAFIPFNFPRATVFMGDAGTYFLGTWVGATAALALGAGLSPLAILLPGLLYAADTFSTLVRRIVRGAQWTHSHREHVYHQIVILGWSHVQTTGLIGAIVALYVVLGTLLHDAPVAAQLLAVAVCLGIAVAYCYLPTYLRKASGLASIPVVTAVGE
jgi:UDP-GlcNAc:undecaprenyl-phosphate GlcNAc-1-phosphate transferase